MQPEEAEEAEVLLLVLVLVLPHLLYTFSAALLLQQMLVSAPQIP